MMLEQFEIEILELDLEVTAAMSHQIPILSMRNIRWQSLRRCRLVVPASSQHIDGIMGCIDAWQKWQEREERS
jgi:hypothetical protein